MFIFLKGKIKNLQLITGFILDCIIPLILIDGQLFDEWVRITPAARKCWNITLQDDEVFELPDINAFAYLSLQIDCDTISRPSLSSYSTCTVFYVDNERGKKCGTLHGRFSVLG